MHRFLILDHSLKSAIGHHLEYGLAAACGAKDAGNIVSIVGHESAPKTLIVDFPFQPFFREAWSDQRKLSIIPDLQCALLQRLGLNITFFRARSFGADLRALLRDRALSAEDAVFVHTITFTQLLQLGLVARSCAAKFHIVVRQNPVGPQSLGSFIAVKLIFAFLRSLSHLRFYSDTRALCQEYTKIYGIECRLLPILFEQEKTPMAAHTSGERLRVVYLGDARLEKGFQHLPRIIDACERLGLPLQFTLQVHLRANDPELQAARDRLLKQAQQSSFIEVVHGEQSQERYLSLLQLADVVLLPYDSAIYRLRSSGIMAQALAAGKFVVAPVGADLVDDAPQLLVRRYKSVDEIASLLGAIVLLAQRQSERSEAAKSFRAAHSSSKLIEILASP